VASTLENKSPPGTAREVLRVSLLLGLTAFGGPLAHLGYFERAYVRERGWLSHEDYGALLALCQVLPGPTSSQVGFLIGWHRAGGLGAVAAWIGFTLPSAVLLFAGALLAVHLHGPGVEAVLHGLKLTAVAVVAQALWSMARSLCTDRVTVAIALAAGALLLLVAGSGAQLLALCLGAVAGLALCHRRGRPLRVPPRGASTRLAWGALALFIALLGLALAVPAGHGLGALAAIFYRAGALVFGGGHVVLPLLRDALVPAGWLSDDRFLTGYGLAQAVPGPLFSVAAYLGAANAYVALPVLAAITALVAIFLPGLLLAVAGVRLWSLVDASSRLAGALTGINAAVVGILGAALYDPVWLSAVRQDVDAVIALSGLLLLERWKAPPPAVLVFCVALALAGAWARLH
jgi:chromate transporter